MKLGPIEVIWNTQTSYRQRLRSIVHEHMTELLNTDAGLRAIIARCGRSAAKDYLAELVEPPPLYPADVPPDHLEQSRLYRLPTEDELQAGVHEVQPMTYLTTKPYDPTIEPERNES